MVTFSINTQLLTLDLSPMLHPLPSMVDLHVTLLPIVQPVPKTVWCVLRLEKNMDPYKQALRYYSTHQILCLRTVWKRPA